MRKFLLVLLAFYAFSLSGKIIETDHFSEISQYMKPHTLIVLDIDDTLLIPVQTLGSDVWFLHRLRLYQSNGLTPHLALDKALAEWEAVRHLTAVKIVEEGSEKIISDLQKQNYCIMGLTTQGLALATRTIHQLLSLNIDLTRTAPSKEDRYFMNGEGVLYRKGALFTAGSPKGKALFTFLDLIDFHPAQVVFINDKATHLKDVEDEAVARDVPFIGLRYTYSDDRVKNFDKEIADIQWNHSTFGHLLSDQAAAELLNEKKS